MGVAVLLFDRRPGAEDRFDAQSADALAALGVLESQPGIDPVRLGLWGFSQGAWVAPLTATRSKVVKFLVVVAASGVTPAEQMRYGTALQLRRAGHGGPEEARMLEARSAMESYQRGTATREAAQASIDAIKHEPWFRLVYLREELPPSPGFWPTVDYDPVPVMSRVRVPTLVFLGEEDDWLPVDASAAAWQAAGIPDLTVMRLPGCGHAVTRPPKSEDIAPEYTATLRSWLGSRVLNDASSQREEIAAS